ncbi:hypothetical protein VNO77_26892 [Canavalia gladiata]|uniref:Uncharacterized protein n=1 Tax=Canavalia gladiata TaxID=3824 RepID=A0AAN9Q3R1_CANGL
MLKTSKHDSRWRCAKFTKISGLDGFEPLWGIGRDAMNGRELAEAWRKHVRDQERYNLEFRTSSSKEREFHRLNQDQTQGEIDGERDSQTNHFLHSLHFIISSYAQTLVYRTEGNAKIVVLFVMVIMALMVLQPLIQIDQHFRSCEEIYLIYSLIKVPFAEKVENFEILLVLQSPKHE